jgi:hypothetical protein
VSLGGQQVRMRRKETGWHEPVAGRRSHFRIAIIPALSVFLSHSAKVIPPRRRTVSARNAARFWTTV